MSLPSSGLDLRAMARERWLACLWAPASARPALLAVHSLDLEMAGVVARVSEPMLAEMRLAWWRERAHELAEGRPPLAQPTLEALAAHAIPAGVAVDRLADRLEDGLLLLLAEHPAELEPAAAARGGALFQALAEALGVTPPPPAVGAAFAASEWWRADWGLRAGAVAAARRPPPPAAHRGQRLPGHLAGLTALADDDARRLAAGRPLRLAAGAGRQWVLARAALSSPR